MTIAAFILVPAAVLGVGAFVMALFDKANRRRRQLALRNKASGRGRQ